jgi:uncharacterized oligopeptide transporter (OPT) family protein
VGGNMPWPLVVVGIFMGFALIMVQVRSPMLFAVGMYLPLETTFAIFLGGRLPLGHGQATATAAASTTLRRRAWRTPAC